MSKNTSTLILQLYRYRHSLPTLELPAQLTEYHPLNMTSRVQPWGRPRLL